MRPGLFLRLAIAACLFVTASGAVLAQNCCIQVTAGASHPADHTWQFDPANPNAPNLMMHAKLCLPTSCQTPAIIRGVRLAAAGTGNDQTDIALVRVWLDSNCDGKGDSIIGQSPGYLADNGLLQICSNTPLTLAPGQCVCILIEYIMKPGAPCEATYGFNLQAVLGIECQPLPLCSTVPFRSAVKTVRCDQCCLKVGYGSTQPPDHSFNCVPGTVSRPNFMMHARICNPCPDVQTIYGLTLTPGGTGNPASVSQVLVFADFNCDGKRDSITPLAQGVLPAGGGKLTLCSPTGGPLFEIGPDNCACLLIYYRMDCPPAPGTYFFEITDILGAGCQTTLCSEGTPLKSAVKTVGEEPCCVKASRAAGFPADHTFSCVPGTTVKPNLMGVFELCNPCPDQDLVIGGLVLQAGGTGNDLTGIDKILVSLDFDCDGKPDSVNVLTGAYSADNGTVSLCTPDGSPLVIPPGKCVCVRVEYVMKCPAPFGTYSFQLTQLLGPDCKEICAETLPLRSAVKTVTGPDPCCPEVSYGPSNPADHTYTCPAAGRIAPNFMQQVRICNPCPSPLPIFGVRLKAYGSGNDATGIDGVVVAVDSNCDGQPDAGIPGVPPATFNADNGVAVVCAGAGPITVLQPGQCICLNIYYRMKCPNPVPGTYQFELTNLLGPNCQPICDYGLPLKSAIKTIQPEPCCLRVLPGPKNPPSHSWGPWMPKRNAMFQFQLCNPCGIDLKVNCIKLQAGGTGNDAADITAVRVFRDANCDGAWQPGEPLVGTGTYPADNGVLTISPAAGLLLTPNQCVCLLVEYVMSGAGTPGSTYRMTLTDVCTTTASGASYCTTGLPLTSNSKTRCLRIGEAKLLPIGSSVCLPRKIVTATFPGRIYIEELFMEPKDPADPSAVAETPSRAAGIAVTGQHSFGATGGQVVDVYGTTALIGCEVVVRPESIQPVAIESPPIQPLGMNNRATGGEAFGNQSGVVDRFFDASFAHGLNNVGLLVKAWGSVTTAGPDSFYIDDGTNLQDGTVTPLGFPNIGLKVDASQAGFVPPVGATVQVTGILKAYPYQGACIRTLMPRVAADIQVLAP